MQDTLRRKIFSKLTYEHKSEALLAREKYLRRVAAHFLTAFGVLAVSLFIGMAGYHFTEGLDWIDSLLNASMILSGMGPVDEIRSTGGKLFASAYSLFSGVVFLAAVSLIIAPVAHRIMHKFHLTTKT